MSERTIKIGSKVSCLVGQGYLFEGVVKYMPAGPGDCWVIIDNNGTPHHVQTFLEIVLNEP